MVILSTSSESYQLNSLTETKSSIETNKRIILSFLKDMSKMTTRLLKLFGIDVAHKPAKSFQSVLCKLEDKVANEREQSTIHKINCSNCEKRYIGQSGRPLYLRLYT